MPPLQPLNEFFNLKWSHSQSHSKRLTRSHGSSYAEACGHKWTQSCRNYHHLDRPSKTLAIDSRNTITNRNYNQIVIFGDSLSDTGNLFAGLQGFFPADPYFQGRFSNGPIWVDQLVPQLGLKPNQVLNFAIGGATTGRDNAAPVLLPGVPLPPLPGLLAEVDQYRTLLDSKPANPNALNVVFAGGNDFLVLPPTLLQGIAAGNVQSFIGLFGAVLQSVQNIATAVTELAHLGATTIAIANLPNLGRTPLLVQQGLSAVATAFTIRFNVVLEKTLIQLERSLKVDIAQVDLFSLGEAIAQRPQEFGFTNLKDPLIRQVNPVNPQGFFYWDDFHPTTQVHSLIADAFKRSLSKPTSSHVLQTSFNAVSNLVNSGTVRPILEVLLSQSSLPNYSSILSAVPSLNNLNLNNLVLR